jgi:hypothetical protein
MRDVAESSFLMRLGHLIDDQTLDLFGSLATDGMRRRHPSRGRRSRRTPSPPEPFVHVHVVNSGDAHRPNAQISWTKDKFSGGLVLLCLVTAAWLRRRVRFMGVTSCLCVPSVWLQSA